MASSEGIGFMNDTMPLLALGFTRRSSGATLHVMDTVTLTRDELYSLVWSKPMTAVAEEFGVSSVAFAKYCVKLGIPRPTRGYWQQLAAGLKPRPDKLPKPGPRT